MQQDLRPDEVAPVAGRDAAVDQGPGDLLAVAAAAQPVHGGVAQAVGGVQVVPQPGHEAQVVELGRDQLFVAQPLGDLQRAPVLRLGGRVVAELAGDRTESGQAVRHALLVTQILVQAETLAQLAAGHLVVALQKRQHAGTGQHRGPQLGRGVRSRRQRAPHPGPTLGVAAPQVAPAPEVPNQTQSRLGIGAGEEVDRLADVPGLRVEDAQPVLLLGRSQVLRRLGGQPAHVVGVPAARQVGLTGLVELVPGELADQLQEHEPGRLLGLVHPADQGLRCQGRSASSTSSGVYASPQTAVADSWLNQIEHRQPGQDPLLDRGSAADSSSRRPGRSAPARPHRPAPATHRRCRPGRRPGRRRTAPALEPRRARWPTAARRAGGRCGRRPRSGRRSVALRRRARAVPEQLHRRRGGDLLDAGPAGRHPERSDDDDRLARDLQLVSGGDEEGDLGTRGHHRLDQLTRRVQHVLGSVGDEQLVPGSQPVDDVPQAHVGVPGDAKVAANAGSRSSERATPPTGNHRTPSGWLWDSAARTAAKRVLPTPPGPVSVTSR